MFRWFRPFALPNLWRSIQADEDMGQLDNTIVVFTSDNGAEKITFPDGGTSPFKGQKGMAWEGGYRVPCETRTRSASLSRKM